MYLRIDGGLCTGFIHNVHKANMYAMQQLAYDKTGKITCISKARSGENSRFLRISAYGKVCIHIECLIAMINQANSSELCRCMANLIKHGLVYKYTLHNKWW